ncbi:PAS domain S-box protein [Massilia glaciei]|uniref:PAS domain S-box protein n=1 Tax=Massilia glaciei TaxID=1524097 RepID=A0A2U2HEM6_9BURK|nr:PAS domain S-box protein [Massilia glaciei]
MNRMPNTAMIGLMLSNPPDRQLLAEHLRQMGYGVRLLDGAGPGGADAHIALVIVDEAAARRHAAGLAAFRRAQQPLAVPMLLTLTGHARAAPWLRAGFDDVLRLPLQKDDLLARLEAFLRLRRHAEDILGESTRRFHAIFDLAPVGIVHMTPEGRLALSNARFRDMLGYAEGALAGLTIDQILHPDDAAGFRRTLARLRPDCAGPVERADIRFRRNDGAPVWTSLAISLVREGAQLRARRSRTPGATRARCGSSSSTSTGSSWSTTRSATGPATACSTPSPRGSGRSCARATPWPASAATSSS